MTKALERTETCYTHYCSREASTCAFLFVACLIAMYTLGTKGNPDDQRVTIEAFAAGVVFLFAAVFLLTL